MSPKEWTSEPQTGKQWARQLPRKSSSLIFNLLDPPSEKQGPAATQFWLETCMYYGPIPVNNWTKRSAVHRNSQKGLEVLPLKHVGHMQHSIGLFPEADLQRSCALIVCWLNCCMLVCELLCDMACGKSRLLLPRAFSPRNRVFVTTLESTLASNAAMYMCVYHPGYGQINESTLWGIHQSFFCDHKLRFFVSVPVEEKVYLLTCDNSHCCPDCPSSSEHLYTIINSWESYRRLKDRDRTIVVHLSGWPS